MTGPRMRRILDTAGLLPCDRARHHPLILIDAEKVTPLLQPSPEMLSSNQVMSRLSLNWNTLKEIQKGNLLRISRTHQHKSLPRWHFDPRDVDAFEDRLFQGAVPADRSASDARDLKECAVATHYPISALIRLVIEDRSLWRARAATGAGVEALLLRPQDVEGRLARQDGMLNFNALTRALGMSAPTVAAILEQNVLPSMLVPRSFDGRIIRMVRRADLALFSATYTTDADLARKRGTTVETTRIWLAAEGIEPVLPTHEDQMQVFRQRDIPSSGLDGDAADPGLSLRQISAKLRMTRTSVSAALERGLIRSYATSGKGHGDDRRVVLAADVDLFHADFVSVAMIAHERDVTAVATQVWLTEEGVAPAYAPELCGEPIYRRTDLPAVDPTPAGRAVPFRSVMAELGVDSKFLASLATAGILPAVIKYRIPGVDRSRVFTRSDIEAFDAEYVSVEKLARERGWTAQRARKWLLQASISPAFAPTPQGNRVYRRSDIRDLGEARHGP